MDGVVGSRLGRSSSRYGGTTTTQAQGSTTFTGPVRKWRRQWVTTSEPADNINNDANKGKHQQLQHQDATTTRPLLLCRWIPVPSTASASAAAASDLPPKRKVRYAPVTVLEEMNKEACTAAGVDAANKVNESEAKLFEKSHYTDAFVQDSEGLMMEHAQVNSQLFLDKF